MQKEQNNYSLIDQDHVNEIQVSVSNPTQVKSTLSTYTVYKVKGTDKEGEFECTRRYSQFDLIRNCLLKRWPGCFVPSLPEKKMVGNSEAGFVEHRKILLEMFCQEMKELKHLWYSQEFQIFIRKTGDVESNLKTLSNESHEDIISKYDNRFTRLKGRSIDTVVLSKVLEFNKYLKKIQPILISFKEVAKTFIDAKRNNYEQYSILLNYVLPEYQKICLQSYLNKNIDGKLIMTDEQDQRLVGFINQIKQIVSERNFDQLLFYVENMEREVNGFLDVYKQHAVYDKKLSQLKQKEKDLELEQQQLNAGKQSLFKSIFKGKIEENKANLEREINANKELISTYNLLSDIIVMILGFFEIDRFREAKFRFYNETIQQIAKTQIRFSRIQKQLCAHILDNHNLI